MHIYRYLFIGLLVANNMTKGMDLVQDTKDKIRSFDAALVVALSQSKEEWSNHSFGSSVVAQIIKKKELNDSHVNEQEVALVKSLKKNEPERYSALIGELFDVLHSEKNNVQRYRNKKFSWDSEHLKGSSERLDDMKKALVVYKDYNNAHNEWWTSTDVLVAASVMSVVECAVVACVIITSFVCAATH